MSFYGTIYNQISNAFEKIFIQNNGIDRSSIEVAEEDYNWSKDKVIKADGREGEFKIDSGNRWILLTGDEVANNCKIYHRKPDDKNLSSVVPVGTVNSEEAKEAIEVSLDKDRYLKFTGVTYDQAGHVSGTTSKYIIFKQVDAKAEISDFKKTVNDSLDDFNGRLLNTEAFKETYDDRLAEEEKKSKTFSTDIKTNEDNISDLSAFVGNKASLGSSLGKDETICSIIGDVSNIRTKGDKTSLCEKVATLDGQVAALMMAFRSLGYDI